MSAICGIYNLDGKPAPREGMEQMVAALAHNGPDGQWDMARRAGRAGALDASHYARIAL